MEKLNMITAHRGANKMSNIKNVPYKTRLFVPNFVLRNVCADVSLHLTVVVTPPVCHLGILPHTRRAPALAGYLPPNATQLFPQYTDPTPSMSNAPAGRKRGVGGGGHLVVVRFT